PADVDYYRPDTCLSATLAKRAKEGNRVSPGAPLSPAAPFRSILGCMCCAQDQGSLSAASASEVGQRRLSVGLEGGGPSGSAPGAGPATGGPRSRCPYENRLYTHDASRPRRVQL